MVCVHISWILRWNESWTREEGRLFVAANGHGARRISSPFRSILVGAIRTFITGRGDAFLSYSSDDDFLMELKLRNIIASFRFLWRPLVDEVVSPGIGDTWPSKNRITLQVFLDTTFLNSRSRDDSCGASASSPANCTLLGFSRLMAGV